MNFNKVDHVLGKTVTNYTSTYNPALLARHERVANRDVYSITDDIFVGYDIWHAYEQTFLLENGQPVTFILKIRVPSTSKYLVESKSLKLYLFSFAMEKMGKSENEAFNKFKSIVEEDLSQLLECVIETQVFTQKSYNPIKDELLQRAVLLDDLTDFSQIEFNSNGEDPSLLKDGGEGEIFIKSDMLRSKCLITGQPDTGTVFIYMKGKHPTYESLAQYICSLREEHHFHEEIVECFYKRLLDLYKPEDLLVVALYNRRGGIDICPIRTSNPHFLPDTLINISEITEKEYRQ